MADKAWKANERDFAKWASSWIGDGVEFTRNEASTNAGSRNFNSDVDLIHPSLAVYRRRGDVVTVVAKGITAELTRQQSGLKTLYKWMDALRALDKSPVPKCIIINNQWLVCDREHFPSFYRELVQQPVRAISNLLGRTIVHVQSEKEFALLISKAEQSRRYARTKKLFPIVVVREPRKRQLVVIDLAEIHSLDSVFGDECS